MQSRYRLSYKAIASQPPELMPDSAENPQVWPLASVAGGEKRTISLRRGLALVQVLSLVALGIIAGVSWVAIDNSNRFAQELAHLSRAQRYHQDADTVHGALRADVLSAFAIQDDNPEAAEVVLANMRRDAARLAATLDSLRQLTLAPDLAQRVASTRTLADAYISRATALTAIAVRSRERALTLKERFEESFNQLREANEATTALFAQRT